MKKILITAAGLLSLAYGQGRWVTATDTRIVTTEDTKLVLDNLHLQHNSQVPQINGVLRFTGNTATTFAGANKQQVYALEIDKTGGAELQLQQDIAVDGEIRFINGKLNLNEAVVQLSPTAKLLGEQEAHRAYTTGNGYFTITVNMNNPSLLNAGNLGAFISSPANLGAVTVRRGHKPQEGTGLNTSISRYFEITPANNTALGATVEFLYFDEERNGQDEQSLTIYQSTTGGAGWTPIGFDQKSAAENYIRKGGLASLHRYTLSAAVAIPLPVLGLEFTAKRLNKQVVQLAWKTAQEIANKGFYLERKKENEPGFSAIYFAPSKGFNGSSTMPLQYTKVDTNSFGGKTWYRLRQEDEKGTFTYSAIRLVDGDPDKLVTLKAWPIPAPKEFTVSVTGIESDVLELYDATGKLVKQIPVQNGGQQKISSLHAGTYFLKLRNQPGLVQKITVL
jgi:hypothetical protein